MDHPVNTRRTNLIFGLTMAIILATGGAILAAAPAAAPTVIVHGIVAATELPDALVLQDGTRVELAHDRGLLFDGDPAAPAPGDEVVVVGHRISSSGVTTIRSAGVIVRTPSGRQLPLPPDPCVTPSASLGLALNPHGARTPLSAGRALPSATVTAASLRDGMELTGTVLSVGSQSFRLQPEHGSALDVFVNVSTVYRNLSSLSDLQAGDTVRVMGSSTYLGFLATMVELMNASDGGGEDTEIEGTVLSVASQSFRLQPDHGIALDIFVNSSTRYMNLGSIADLTPGDTVRVVGRDPGSGFLASVVELMSSGGGGGGEDMEIRGVVLSVNSQSFRLQPDIGNALDVFVDANTRYMNLQSISDLRPGDAVRVVGYVPGTGFLASIVELMSGDGGGGGGGEHGGVRM
ncbi:MAG TPA: hypothetical protein ENK19_00330, partial [Acidobacteria bacterium]|nr:hypothetical protein [Acidobacteriota bacterium]